jgi:hypothetical protein
MGVGFKIPVIEMLLRFPTLRCRWSYSSPGADPIGRTNPAGSPSQQSENPAFPTKKMSTSFLFYSGDSKENTNFRGSCNPIISFKNKVPAQTPKASISVFSTK